MGKLDSGYSPLAFEKVNDFFPSIPLTVIPDSTIVNRNPPLWSYRS
jgi:hypothetical protein